MVVPSMSFRLYKKFNALLETQSVQEVASLIATHFGSQPIPPEFLVKLHPALAHAAQQHAKAQAILAATPWHALLGSARADLLTAAYPLDQTAEQRHAQAQIQTTAWWADRVARTAPLQVLEQLAEDFDFPARLPATSVLVEILTDPARGACPKAQATAAVRAFLADRREQAVRTRQIRDMAKAQRQKLRAARSAARAQVKAIEAQRIAEAHAQLNAQRTVPDDDRRSWRTVAEVATMIGRSSSTVLADIRKNRLGVSGWTRGSWGNDTSLHSRVQILDYIQAYRPEVDHRAVDKPTPAELRAYRDLVRDTRWAAIQGQAAQAGHVWGQDLPPPASWPARLALRLQPVPTLIDQVGTHAHTPAWSDVTLQLAQAEACWNALLAERLTACRWSESEVKGLSHFLDTQWKPLTPLTLPWPQPVYDPALRGQLKALLDGAFESYARSAELVSSAANLLPVGTLDQPLSWFAATRARPRRWVLHVGPTNSGKTHQAMVELLAAPTGVYLAPLRLLALEGFDRMRAAGAHCVLHTGEERQVHVPTSITSSTPTHVSATIEIAAADDTPYAVAIIDEAQMIDDPGRGWAWAQALAGIRADVIHVCLAPQAQSRIVDLINAFGETFTVVNHTRLTPLTRLSSPVALKKLEPGDALIVFSRRQLLGYRAWLRHRGKSVAVLYGDLGPEVRRAEAERFRSGAAQILVATDAIGMGLNLPIRRVVFSQTEKFDGRTRRSLYKSEWSQIAGRAGRHGLYDEGFYGLLGSIDRSAGFHGDPPPLSGPVRFRPTLPVVRALAHRLGWTSVGQVAQFWHSPPPGIVPSHAWTEHGWLDRVAASGLPLDEQYAYLGAPINAAVVDTAASWLASHAQGHPVLLSNVPDITPASSSKELSRLEALAARVRLYRWCALQFPQVYRDDPQTLHEALSVAISTSLETMALDNLCDGCGCRLPVGHRHANCDDCFHGQYNPSRFNDEGGPWDDEEV